MKIVQVMLAKGFGGAERSFVDLSDELVSRGHEVTAVCERRGKSKDLIKKAHVELITVRGHWDPFARRAINNILRKKQPEILHAHLARAAKIGGAAASTFNIPSVVKTHNYVDLKYYTHISCLVPTTKDQEKYLLSHGVPQNQITRIANFTSVPFVHRPRGFSPTQQIHIVAIGRFVEKKGFDLLIQALARLPADLPVHLTLVGDGQEKSALVELARQSNLAQRVQFTGWSNDVVAALDSADLFVLPSRDEPFGIVCLEAMARGVPIIATNTQGPSEFLDNSLAWLVQRDDLDALTAGLEAAINNPEQATQKAEKALRTCEAQFSKEVIVGQYEALYADIAG